MAVVGYVRVSTERQGISGLGVEAQKAAIEAHAASRGEAVHAWFFETETGTAKRRRPVFEAAVLACRNIGATLVAAKLDRIARDVAAVVKLRESGVKFVALDLPETENPLFLYVIAALAEYEAKLISQRTKAALAAKKARGEKLGTPENLQRGRGPRPPGAIRRRAWEMLRPASAYGKALRRAGMNWTEIANALNRDGYLTPGRRPFTHTTAKRVVLRRYDDE